MNCIHTAPSRTAWAAAVLWVLTTAFGCSGSGEGTTVDGAAGALATGGGSGGAGGTSSGGASSGEGGAAAGSPANGGSGGVATGGTIAVGGTAGEPQAGGTGGTQYVGPHISTSSLTVDPTATLGGTIDASVTLTNDGTETVDLFQVVITARQPPGYTAPPYLDFGPRLQNTTLAPGESVTLSAALMVDAAGPAGTYHVFATYEDASGWHDQPAVDVQVGVAGTGGTGGDVRVGVAGTGGTGGGGGTGGASTGGASTGGASTGGSGGTGGCTGTVTPVCVHGQLRIEGNKFVDQSGRPVTLHGMSMYDWSEQGRQFYNTSAVGRLATDMKCTVLRIPILPSNYPGAVNRVKTVVDACIANGIYAILDWHSMGGANAGNASAFFEEMARAYGNTPNVMYEPWNEPVNESWQTIKAYHETVIRAIRAIDPDNIIILGNRQWDQNPQEAADDPVTISTNLAYTVHFYAASHSLAGWFQDNIETALSKPLALFVTEYGGCEANGSGNLDEAEVRNWWSFLDANGIGCTAWAVETNSETSSVFVTDASDAGPWANGDLTNWGRVVFPYIASQYAATVAP
jgi:endoglucanase